VPLPVACRRGCAARRGGGASIDPFAGRLLRLHMGGPARVMAARWEARKAASGPRKAGPRA
jgi:hypothetical protein